MPTIQGPVKFEKGKPIDAKVMEVLREIGIQSPLVGADLTKNTDIEHRPKVKQEDEE